MNHSSAAAAASPSSSMSDHTPPPLPAGELDEEIAHVRAQVSAAANSNRFSLRSNTNSSRSSTNNEQISIPNPRASASQIDPKLFRILVAGNKSDLLETLGFEFSELRSAVDDNSVLHIAASSRSQSTLISELLPNSGNLIKVKNSKGDLAFHTAVKGGNLENLEAMCDWGKYDSEMINAGLLGFGNNEGDTPLHIAMMNNDKEMGVYLVKQYPEACYQLNKKMVAPIYLAIKAGFWSLVRRMIELIEKKEDVERALLCGKSVVHAGIEAQQLEILTVILENFPNLTESLGEGGRTPLSYAAFKGYLQGVQYLLKEFPDCAYKCDQSGAFPIHNAASGGHVKAIKALHSTKELCNRKGQNILHVAALNGKSEAVLYLLKMPELERLINMKDEDGNTPLHLATLGFHPRVVYILTRETKVKPELKNKDGLTALDVAEIHAGPNPTFEARLTWMALRYINAPRSSQSTRKSYAQREEGLRYCQHTGQIRQKKKQNKKQLESYKDRIDTHLLVATLVATVTFAAGFTLPGGYNQDSPHKGMTVLPHKWAFHVFVICNTAAMYSSILAVVTLIWAHMGDLKLILMSLRFALPLLGFALAMMSLAFMMGVYVVLRNQLWLSYVVLAIGSLFLAVVLVFFIPLYNPSYIRNSVVRFFFSGTFLLLLLVCEKSHIDYA